MQLLFIFSHPHINPPQHLSQRDEQEMHARLPSAMVGQDVAPPAVAVVKDTGQE